MKTLILIFTSLIVLAGCQNEYKNDNTAKQLEDRDRLLAQYKSIEGLYQGTVNPQNASSYPVELSLFIVETPEGNDPNGIPKMRPSLKSRFRRLDIPLDTDDDLMETTYFAEVGQIVMSSAKTGNNLFTSLRGRTENDWIRGEVVQAGGVLGTIEVHKTQQSAPRSIGGNEEEKRQRQRREYEKLVGRFVGTVISSEHEPFPISLEVFISEEEAGKNSKMEPLFVPVLKAHYKRLDVPAGLVNVFLSVRYFPESRILVMKNITEQGAPIPLPGAGYLSLTLKVQVDGQGQLVLKGSVVDQRGPLGNVETIRK